jgi:hypothetical protein
MQTIYAVIAANLFVSSALFLPFLCALCVNAFDLEKHGEAG